jgi:hypothetical protein
MGVNIQIFMIQESKMNILSCRKVLILPQPKIVKVFGYLLIITTLAILCTSYTTHSWPFGAPGAQSAQEKMIQSALGGNNSVGPSTSKKPEACTEADDGDIAPCP